LNPNAPANWLADVEKWRAGLGVTHEHLSYEMGFWNVEGGFAYAVISHYLWGDRSIACSFARAPSLRDYETVVNLIAGTTTAKGLKVTSRLDRRKYRTGRKVTAAEMKQINLERHPFHGEWNYIISPASE
jgi:hypothetical protein